MNVHDTFETEDKLYIILDYIIGGNNFFVVRISLLIIVGELFYHLKKDGRFSESRVKLYSAEVASALTYLHSINIFKHL